MSIAKREMTPREEGYWRKIEHEKEIYLRGGLETGQKFDDIKTGNIEYERSQDLTREEYARLSHSEEFSEVAELKRQTGLTMGKSWELWRQRKEKRGEESQEKLDKVGKYLNGRFKSSAGDKRLLNLEPKTQKKGSRRKGKNWLQRMGDKFLMNSGQLDQVSSNESPFCDEVIPEE